AKATDVPVTLVVCRFWGTDGAEVSPTAGVVTGSAVLGFETFPAASRARTVYEYAEFGATVPSVYEFVDAVPITLPSRSTSYVGMPTLSVEVFHASTTWFTLTVVVWRFAGTDGATTSGVVTWSAEEGADSPLLLTAVTV